MIRITLTLITLCLSTAKLAADPFFENRISAQAMAAFAARDTGQPTQAENWMVSAANPLAVEAGADVLRRGGTAADAMVAVQAVLGLVEPQSSGLGGGAFLIWHDAASGALTTLDGRETAPLDVTPKLFLNENGEPLKFFDAVIGGRSVGVPATPALMQEAHRRWGNQPWSGLLTPARDLASEGFAVSPRLAGLIRFDRQRLQKSPSAMAYLMPGGQPLNAGDTLTNPDYAETLDQLSQHGAAAFATGPLAESIVNTVQTADNPGVLSALDLAIYRVKERAPVCAPYRGFQICGMGPPSSGGLTVGQILRLLEPYDLRAMGPDDPHSWRLIGDASRLAFADRGRFMADSDFVPVPVAGLLDPAYTASRAELLQRDTALTQVRAGAPAFDHSLLWAEDRSLELPSTSHISIVDSYGNALSMTTTIENLFGSRLMAGGFFLNNELTDFSFRTHIDGLPIANRVAPGKRPRSSMSPTIVFKDGKPVLVIGSPGGSSIIGFVAQTIIAHLDWDMDIQAAISMPRRVNKFGRFDLEEAAGTDALAAALGGMRFETRVRRITSGLHGIAIGDGLQGGADPRREGIALGE